MQTTNRFSGFLAATVLAVFSVSSTGAPVDFTNAAPRIEDVRHSPAQPHSHEPTVVTAKVAGQGIKLTLEYQVVDPGKYIALRDAEFQRSWTPVGMNDAGTNGDAKAGDGIYTVALPADLQRHRRLVRYRITGSDAKDRRFLAPAPDDAQTNFAYFVYDGIPAWKGAIDARSNDPELKHIVQFDPAVMQKVQSYHFISKASSVENATWREQPGGKEYKYTGTLVVDGKVYDHVPFRARGGVWRYAMGKNMWKFEFNKGHHLEARNDFGQPYQEKWGKLNLRACIQQGDYGYRGEQGMFESVGFKLFALAGVPAPRTHWIQLRIIDEAEENPGDQYHGDFWGLYLAIENEDNHFLAEHDLPPGNLYKMEGGSGTLHSHAPGAVTNRSDLDHFMGTYYGRNPSDGWWRTNLDLARYYSYRSILECIHHYDVSDGKNYDYYLNPKTSQWTVIPWDIDLSWADHMYGGGEEPFKSRVLSHPVFRREYQNRLREIRDLLFNTDQAWQLINESAAIISDPAGGPSPADADRMKWDYHPAMAMGGKAGQGLFYQAAPSRDFRGIVRLMRNYVKTRGAWVDANLLRDPAIPKTPALTAVGPTNFLAAELRFRSSEYQGTSAFAAMKWRVGEVAPTNAPPEALKGPRPYEVTPTWESPELGTFSPDITIPPTAVKVGRVYRVRVRMKDETGRWSHWSRPIQFTAN